MREIAPKLLVKPEFLNDNPELWAGGHINSLYPVSASTSKGISNKLSEAGLPAFTHGGGVYINKKASGEFLTPIPFYFGDE